MKQLNDNQLILLFKMSTKDNIEKMKLSFDHKRWVLQISKKCFHSEPITDNESKMLNLIRKKYIREVLGK